MRKEDGIKLLLAKKQKYPRQHIEEAKSNSITIGQK
jgi:hypothetical protein